MFGLQRAASELQARGRPRATLATRTADMRNAAIVVTIIYIALDIALRPFGATGAWTAITTSYLLRGVTLLIRLPALVRDIKTVADNKKRNQTCPIHVD